jgi:DNA-binding MarR family transcriptional regulator
MSNDFNAQFYEILGLIRRNQLLTDLLDEGAATYLGINRTDARAIDAMTQHDGPISAGDLARELRVSPGAVTTIVDRLERAGYARRVPDPEDRRRVLIETTPIVAELSAQIYGTPEEGAAENVGRWTGEEGEVILRFQRESQAWLEGRLDRVEKLIAERDSASPDSAS